MDKPVSEPTAPAEPPLSLERENEQFRMESGRIDAIVSASNRMTKDAARYRWLRDNRSSVTYTIRPGEESSNCEIHGHDGWTRRCDMDAAIDAAMKG